MEFFDAPSLRLVLSELHLPVSRNVAKLCGGMLADGKYSFVAVWMCTDFAVVVVVTAHAMQIFVMRWVFALQENRPNNIVPFLKSTKGCNFLCSCDTSPI